MEKAVALVRCGVDALYIGDASASASVISPRQFEEFCFPRFRRFCEELRRRGVLIYLHICGNSLPLLEMMAETGVDCIEPLDPLGGVTVAEARRRVGARVALMGGVNTLTLLNGTPEAVREEALACCRAGGADGGYILAAGDMVPDFTPEANLHALVRAAKDFTA
jgi:uroporphyrinogen-III decarboxylase